MAEANGMKRRGHSQGVKSGGQTPSAQRKIIVYIATSADGYIARPNGSVDWLNRPMPKGAYGMTAFARSIDTILWGRKTYDFAAKMGGVGAYGKVKHYAFSHQPPSDPLPGVELGRTEPWELTPARNALAIGVAHDAAIDGEAHRTLAVVSAKAK